MKTFSYPAGHSARKAFNSARRKRETWMRPLEEAMFRRANMKRNTRLFR